MITRLVLLAFVCAIFLALVEYAQAQQAPPVSCEINLDDTAHYAGMLEQSQMSLQRRLAIVMAERDRLAKHVKALTDELAALKGPAPKPEDMK